MELTSYDWMMIAAALFNAGVGLIGFIIVKSRRVIVPHYDYNLGMVCMLLLNIVIGVAITSNPIAFCLSVFVLVVYVIGFCQPARFSTEEWMGWVVSFNNVRFFTTLPRIKGKLYWNPFIDYVDGFKLWHEIVEAKDGRKLTYTLVFKATEDTDIKIFQRQCWNHRSGLYKTLVHLMDVGVSRNEIAEQMKLWICMCDVGVVEIQKPQYFAPVTLNIISPGEN